MSDEEKRTTASTVAEEESHHGGALKALKHADDALLATLGYRSEFRREFSVCLCSGCALLRTLCVPLTLCALYAAHRDNRIRVFDHGRRRIRILNNVLPTHLRYVS